MTDLNNVFLIGRLTRDMEIRYSNGGMPIGRFSLAVNRSKKTGDKWEDEANFFDCTLFGKTADTMNQYLTKGKQVAVSGELRQSRWEQDGQNRSRVEIAVNNIQLLGGKSEGSSPVSGGSAPVVAPPADIPDDGSIPF